MLSAGRRRFASGSTSFVVTSLAAAVVDVGVVGIFEWGCVFERDAVSEGYGIFGTPPMTVVVASAVGIAVNIPVAATPRRRLSSSSTFRVLVEAEGRLLLPMSSFMSSFFGRPVSGMTR